MGRVFFIVMAVWAALVSPAAAQVRKPAIQATAKTASAHTGVLRRAT